MALDEEKEELAAEYALGTLSHGERKQTGSSHPIPPLPHWFPPGSIAWCRWRGQPGRWPRRPMFVVLFLARISAGGQSSGNVVSLRRQVSLWRSASVALAALAAVLAGFIFIGPRQAGEQARYVAVLQSEGPGPAFVASIDLASGTIAVRRVGAEPQPGKSYELWAVGGGREKPQSLGVIDASLKVPARNMAPRAGDGPRHQP